MPDRRRARDLVLASASPTRRRLLAAAGVAFEVVPPAVDEGAFRRELPGSAGGPPAPRELARLLARAKAEEVSRRRPAAVVIGADQVLDAAGRVLGKPPTIDDARRMLLALRGGTHSLHSAVAVARAGAVTWDCTDTASLTVRAFSPAFLEEYLRRAGEAVLSSAGAYQIEGVGAQLFERIAGDYFTILGLPLVPLLGRLRQDGALAV